MSEVKIKEFLRGQKIPLHRRGSAPILCIEIDSTSHIAAVYVENKTDEKERWIINGMFTPDEGDTKFEQVLIRYQKQ